MAELIQGYTVEVVNSLQWANVEQTAFNCIAKFAEAANPIPFTAVPDDIYTHTWEIWERGLNGEFGEISPMEPPVEDPAAAMALTSQEDLMDVIKSLEARLAALESKT